MDLTIPERHVSARKEKVWRTPPIRLLLSVRKPNLCEQETGLCGISLKQLKDQIATIDRFIRLCDVSLELVKRISATLVPLLQRIISQYLRSVCGTCVTALQTTISAVDGASMLRKDLQLVDDRQDDLLRLLNAKLEADNYCGEGWIAITVCDLVYYAFADLAVRHGIDFGDDFAGALKSVEPQVSRWMQHAEPFAPSTLCYDLHHCVVGTTFARWDGWKQLEAWEKNVRKWRMRHDIRRECDAAQEGMRGVVVAMEGTDRAALLEAARRVVARGGWFSMCGGCGPWWSADGRSLLHKDQCPTCQVWFHGARLEVPNQPEHRDRLGEKRDAEHAWQCAEVDLLSLLQDLGVLGDAEEAVQPANPSPILCMPHAGSQ